MDTSILTESGRFKMGRLAAYVVAAARAVEKGGGAGSRVALCERYGEMPLAKLLMGMQRRRERRSCAADRGCA